MQNSQNKTVHEVKTEETSGLVPMSLITSALHSLPPSCKAPYFRVFTNLSHILRLSAQIGLLFAGHDSTWLLPKFVVPLLRHSEARSAGPTPGPLPWKLYYSWHVVKLMWWPNLSGLHSSRSLHHVFRCEDSKRFGMFGMSMVNCRHTGHASRCWFICANAPVGGWLSFVL